MHVTITASFNLIFAEFTIQVTSEEDLEINEDLCDSIFSMWHTRMLKAEFNKSHRNQQVVNELMDRTFPFRRQTILETKNSPFCRKVTRYSQL